jgi:predicted amidohydrolase
MEISVAQVKVYPVKGDLVENHGQLMAALQAIAGHRVDVVVTPECFLDGYVVTEDYVSGDNLADYAVDPPASDYVDAVAGWAAKNRCWVILGCTRLAPDGIYNTALIINRAGALVGHYDKVHCQTHDQKFSAGKALPVFESDFGTFGVMICAGRRWPETVRTLALKGAQIIFNPTYGMHDERNLHMMQTRSYESETFIIFTHPGQALITGPRGEVVTNLEVEGESFAVTTLELDDVDRVRVGGSAHLRDRRPDVYFT